MHRVLFELHLFKIQSLNLVHDDQKEVPFENTKYLSAISLLQLLLERNL